MGLALQAVLSLCEGLCRSSSGWVLTYLMPALPALAAPLEAGRAGCAETFRQRVALFRPARYTDPPPILEGTTIMAVGLASSYSPALLAAWAAPMLHRS